MITHRVLLLNVEWGRVRRVGGHMAEERVKQGEEL